jgi:hypothetical protein
MKVVTTVILLALLSGCANLSNGRAKVELGFGSFIGQYLPRLVLEFEVKQENKLIESPR